MVKPLSDPSKRTFASPSFPMSAIAFFAHEPLTTMSAWPPEGMRFMGTMPNCMVAPPPRSRMSYESGTSSSARRPISADSCTSSYSLERWLVSTIDRPMP